MKQVLPYTNEEIAERVALRRACYEAASRTMKAAEARARKSHFDAVRARTDSRFSDDVVRDAAKATFRFTPDAEVMAEVEAQRAAAEEALPTTIKGEHYVVGDCGCVVWRIYHVDFDDPADRQIYAVDRFCDAHDGLSLNDLHDAMQRERILRSRAHRLLIDDDAEMYAQPATTTLEWRWEGRGKDRKLVVCSCHMTPERTAALAALASELGEAGAIEARISADVQG